MVASEYRSVSVQSQDKLLLNLRARRASILCQDPRVPTTEGRLIAKWREALGLSQRDLGDQCPDEKAGSTIARYEVGESRMAVDTLLNVIHGLGVPGATDEQRLSRFFLGPEDAWSDQVFEDARRAERALKTLRLGIEARRPRDVQAKRKRET
jgi:transcriptional regulator with XRE-family HTH domain